MSQFMGGFSPAIIARRYYRNSLCRCRRRLHRLALVLAFGEVAHHHSRGPYAEINWINFWKMPPRHRQGKSPLAFESIDDCYCRMA